MTALLPRSWRPDLATLLPDDARTYRGAALALWVTAAYLVALTVRSLIHLLSPDGGAHSIATIDTSVAGGANIVAIFGQWGASQLLLAGLLWVLLLRYRGLLPLVLCVLLVEPALRWVAGTLKPVETVGTAPGAALNGLVVPFLVVLLYLALCPASPAAADG